MWVVAQSAEHLAVNEAVAGSSPVDPPSFGAVAERRMHFAVDEDDDGSSPFGPANYDGRLAETDQRRPEEPKSLARY
jgi:hypothetical protein